ncbi:DUF192 domain-containing protein [Robiginitalea marina]|uniref:DUF192 domain-containing protein n=1 Tax=Robiginitalea marina TaxID=2954105 RepID=A0ABT1B2R6_9FLAO|nr:DUF192 domain-containing protein [Robiginitalea marina]MCO5725903.1 DUF192 domain-containing protein [Robiginitalea marina]
MPRLRNIARLACLLPVLAILWLGPAGCREENTRRLETEPVVFTREGKLQIYRAESDSLLATLDIELARTEYEIQTGLMYRPSMEDHQGMLFIFKEEAPRSFYMKNTLIPLDIIYLDSDLRVVSIRPDAEPLNESGIPSGQPAQYVLEIKAGLAGRWDIREGDRIRYETME